MEGATLSGSGHRGYSPGGGSLSGLGHHGYSTGGGGEPEWFRSPWI